MDQPLWETTWQFLIKPSIDLPYNPTIPLLPIYVPKRSKNICLYKDLHAKVHNSFIYKSPKLKMTQMPPTPWTHKLWHIHITELYSIILRINC